MRVFVGLGEGIGNVIMGLPLVDGLLTMGHEVTVHLRPTPRAVGPELLDLIGSDGRGRSVSWLLGGDDPSRDVFPGNFHAAFLTHWWLSVGGKTGRFPRASEVFAGRQPSDEPEILSNLAAGYQFLGSGISKRCFLWGSHFQTAYQFSLAKQIATARAQSSGTWVAIHPGCKDDAEWKRRKVYRRWAEVVHALQDRGAYVTVVGTVTDDAYCGRPECDHRASGLPLEETARMLAGSEVVISGDSGIHHLAVALGKPTVVLFGESSIGKATHPDPFVKPIVLGPGFATITPEAVADAAIQAAAR